MRQGLKGQNGNGWRVHEVRGRIFLTVTHEDGQRSTLQTDLEWAGSSTADLLKVSAELKQRMSEQHLGLKEAYALAGESGNTSSGNGTNWEVAIERFRAHKMGSGDLGTDNAERTWHRNYRNLMEHALAALTTSPRPSSARMLFDRLRDECTLTPGSTGRRLRMQYTAAMLRYAVESLGADPRWAPPMDLKPYVGVKQKGKQQTTFIKDDQIARLLTGITDPKWRTAVAVVACFGLRPVELHTIRADGDTLYVGWQKRTARKPEGTKPRNVVGIDPIGLEGTSENLLAVLAERGMDALPAACHHERCGERLEKTLTRNKVWQKLVDEVAATPAVGSTGNELVPYSLRHAYADRADRIGMTDKEAALQMGHSVQTHNSHYTGTGADTAARALAKARAAARVPMAGPDGRMKAPPWAETFLTGTT